MVSDNLMGFNLPNVLSEVKARMNQIGSGA